MTSASASRSATATRLVELDAGARDRERHRVDRPERAGDPRPGLEVVEDAAGLTQQRRDGVVAADRLVADDAEPDVLGHRGERPEQHRLADATQPGEHQVLRAALGDQPAQADLGGFDQLVAPDEGRRRRAGTRRVRVGHRVVLFT